MTPNYPYDFDPQTKGRREIDVLRLMALFRNPDFNLKSGFQISNLNSLVHPCSGGQYASSSLMNSRSAVAEL
jgi:hypothetical protein